jgi:hypothetical protein
VIVYIYCSLTTQIEPVQDKYIYWFLIFWGFVNSNKRYNYANSLYSPFICRRNARENRVIWWKLTVQQKIVSSDPNSIIQVKCLAGHYEYIFMVSFSFMVVGIFVHMSLLNMLIYIDVLCVPITIHFNDLKYLSHLSWFNVSDSYLTCLAW